MEIRMTGGGAVPKLRTEETAETAARLRNRKIMWRPATVLKIGALSRSSISSKAVSRWSRLNLPASVVAQVQIDFVKGAFLDEAFQAHHFRLDLEVLALERSRDFRRAHRTVQVAFLVGVGLDLHGDPLNLFR